MEGEQGIGLESRRPKQQSAIARWQICSLFSAFIIYYMTATVATVVHLVNFFLPL
jgi:hypothetical protein